MSLPGTWRSEWTVGKGRDGMGSRMSVTWYDAVDESYSLEFSLCGIQDCEDMGFFGVLFDGGHGWISGCLCCFE